MQRDMGQNFDEIYKNEYMPLKLSLRSMTVKSLHHIKLIHLEGNISYKMTCTKEQKCQFFALTIESYTNKNDFSLRSTIMILNEIQSKLKV